MAKHLSLLLLLLLASCSDNKQDIPSAQPAGEAAFPAQTRWSRAGEKIVSIAEIRMENLPGPEGLDLQNEQQRIQNYQWHSWEFALNTAREWTQKDIEQQHELPKMTYAQVVDRVNSTLTEQGRQYAVLYGDLEATREREGTCRVIMGWAKATGGYGNTLAAYIDTKTDELVFLWVVPCG